MAFEKMTAVDLFDKFVDLFPSALGGSKEKCIVSSYQKIGARMLRMEMDDGHVLYFLWYDENNWNLGTKPYRKRPVKQQMHKVLKECNTFEELAERVEHLPEQNTLNLDLEDLVTMTAINTLAGDPPQDHTEEWKKDIANAMNTKRYEMITGCNQTHPDPPGAPGMSGVEPIDWVKDN